MTHPDTIKLLHEDYLLRIKNGEDAAKRRDNLLATAKAVAGIAAEDLAIAAELAELLRTLDPDGDYRAPDALSPAEPELATGLRQLADLMAKHPEFAQAYKVIQHSCSDGSPGDRIRRVEELADLAGVEPRWDGHHYAAVVELAGGLNFLIVTTNSYVAAHTARVLPPEVAEALERQREVAAAYAFSAAAAAELIAPPVEDDDALTGTPA